VELSFKVTRFLQTEQCENQLMFPTKMLQIRDSIPFFLYFSIGLKLIKTLAPEFRQECSISLTNHYEDSLAMGFTLFWRLSKYSKISIYLRNKLFSKCIKEYMIQK
jgi:hypothetical protein